MGVLTVTAAAGLVAGGRPAAADPPEPTRFRSEIEAVDAPPGTVDARVLGGDAFLEISVTPGHEAVVYGYQGEPYLRVRADGAVERNRRSPATWLNEDRRGTATLPPDVDPQADAAWEQVTTDGTYAWHDHRIHWMQEEDPTGVEPGGVVLAWTVPLQVDGTPAEVRGRLVLAEPVSPVPWVLLAVAAGVAVVLGARRAAETPAWASTASAVIALMMAWGQWATAPAGSGPSQVPVATAAVGFVGAVAAMELDGRGQAIATLVAGSAASAWALLRLEVLWMPVLPTTLPFAVDRAVTALALGLGATSAALAAWRAGRPAVPAA